MTIVVRIAVWIGGLALVTATGVNTLAVVGRRTGFPLHGAIEIVQLCVLIAGGLALMLATLWHAHARIGLVLDRIGPAGRTVGLRLTAGLAALAFAALCIGSGWIASDLWNSHETSEILGLQWLPMRVFATLAMAVVSGLFLATAAGLRR